MATSKKPPGSPVVGGKQGNTSSRSSSSAGSSTTTTAAAVTSSSSSNEVTTAAPTPAVITSFPAIPLTTTFTPPIDCSGIYSSSVNIIDVATTCLPSGFDRAPTAYFSPGIACPSGYYSACHDTTGVSSITTVTCCPSREYITLSCNENSSSLSGIWSTMFCTWVAPVDGMRVSMTHSADGVTSTVVTTLSSPDGLNAFGVRMVYELTDLLSNTATGTSDTTTLAATTTTMNGPSVSQPASGSDPSSGRLSNGSIAAIAVITPLVVVAAIVGIYFWLRKRRARYREVTSPTSAACKHEDSHYASSAEVAEPPPASVELQTTRQYQPYRPGILAQMGSGSGHQLSELPPSGMAAELPTEPG